VTQLAITSFFSFSMRRRPLILRIFSLSALAVLAGWLAPLAALAVQEHAAPEGLYAHQFAHLFFIASMGLLIFWLRQRQLVKQAGWRYIQYAALFLIFWNIDAFTAHLLDEQLAVVDIQKIEPWTVLVDTGDYPAALAWMYYAAKLDHLLCVPALLFLYAGLRRLLKDSVARGAEEGPA
jgi:hypothetical protein